MSPSGVSGPDDVQGLLQIGSDAAADDEFRQSLLVRTTGVLRRRRRANRLGVAAALLGCYLAGIATMQLYRLGTRSPQPSLAAADQSLRQKTVRAGPDGRTESPPGREQTPPPASTPYEALCRLSDRCLQQGDISAAVQHSYRALKHASTEERAFSPDDNWIVMSLKMYP